MTIIEGNKKEFELCNIPLWWSKGYTGKGIKLAEIEPVHPLANSTILDGKLHDPFDIGKETTENSHAGNVMDIMHQVAYDAELYSLPSSGVYSTNSATGDFINKTLPYVINEKIDILGASLMGVDNDILNNKILEAQKNGTIFCCSAGNENIRDFNKFANHNVWISIGAVFWNTSMQRIELANYSSQGEELDFVTFSELFIHNVKNPSYTWPVSGTSFSNPFFVGQLALVQQFFYEKTGKKLSQQQMYKFVQDHVKDLGTLGQDTMYGYGLFVLPNPDTIDVNKYIGDDFMFKDINLVSSWAKEAVNNIENLGLMKGDAAGNFNPKMNLTREEFAVVIDRLYKLIK